MKTNAQNNDFIRIVEYATKAPSGHNTQPWLFRIDYSTIEIHPNMDVSLSAVDSNNRELYISLGCALENLCLAAQNFGYIAEPSIVSSDSIQFIRVELNKGETGKNPLFNEIEKRQSNRSVYNGKLIEPHIVELLTGSLGSTEIFCYAYSNGNSDFENLLNLIVQGNQIQMQDEHFKNELLQWIRFNNKHSEKTMNGLSNRTLGSPSLPVFMAKPIVRSFLNPKSQNKTDIEKIESSSHLLLLTIPQNSPETWVKLGQALQRLLLTCVQNGIAVAFMNQPCEIETLSAQVQHKVLRNDEIPAILL